MMVRTGWGREKQGSRKKGRLVPFGQSEGGRGGRERAGLLTQYLRKKTGENFL